MMAPHSSANVEQRGWKGPVVQVIVRFASVQPDLDLDIGSDARIVPAALLRQSIRARLPPDVAKCRLRLIHAGKLLRDEDAVSTYFGKESGTWDEDLDQPAEKPVSEQVRKVYIHCSVGDTLSDEELLREQDNAQILSRTLEEKYHQDLSLEDTNSHLGDSKSSKYLYDSKSSVFEELQQIRPQGFDRLLNQGFSREDVASLRATFLSSLSQSRTASQLPTGDDLRLMEDQWLDSTAFGSSDSIGDDDGLIGAMDDLLIGFVIGFFWPVAGLWAFRDYEMWSERRQSAIWIGIVANVVFGFIRYITFKIEGA